MHAIGFQIAAATVGAATIPGLTGMAIEPWGVEIIAKVAVGVAVSLFVIHESILWLHSQRTSL